RHFAVGFSIGNKGYMGTGGGKDDFWEFDPATSDSGTWTKKEPYGGGPRWGSTGFSVAGKGYIGTGYNEKNISQNDFWEYDPLVDKWTKKADLTMSGRSFATGFSIGSKGYIGTGGEMDTKSGLNDFWEYDPLTDNWTKRANFGGPGRIWATGFSIGSKGYIGTSGEPGSDFWEYSALSSPTITTSVAVNSLCAGSSFGVTYSSIGDYNAGNMFTAQLSDSTGSFTTPVNIGTVSSLVSGSINATIPTSTLAGSAYRVRVISSDPVNTGGDNGSNLAISTIPVLTSTLTPDEICNNTTFNYTPTGSPAGITFSWKRAALNGISNVADSSAPGNTKGIICEKLTNTTSSPVNVTYRYYLNNNGCTNTIPYSVVVPVKPSPLVKTRNIMVYLNADGIANITPEQVDNGSVSYCGNITYALDKYSFGCAELGANMVTLTATDAAGNISSGTANVTVLDKLAPEITGACASPNTLWPPNKKMRKVEVNYNTTDNCSVKSVTLSVTSNEIQCGRDVDWVILDNHHLLLRAERQGNKKERIYTIVITAQDAAGNISTQKLTVTVPRKQPGSWKEGTSEDAKIAGVETAYSGLSVQAMPNPSQHYFTLITHAVNNEPITIRVTDVAGRVIEVKQNMAANGSIQIGQQYKSGTYYVELIQGENKTAVTLLKKGD
ncbi:MAG: T9SS type A sorting domain-containing protein, partial [Ferruginibacter sp.]